MNKGRFDELFFIDLPGDIERFDIINLYIKRNLLPVPSGETMESLVELSQGFAGADLEGAVRDVAIQAVIHGNDIVNDALFVKCFKNIVPLSKTSPERIDAIRAWGRERAVPASGISWDTTPKDQSPGKRSILI